MSSRSLTGSTRSAPPAVFDGVAGLRRLYDEDYGILALLDRAGLVPRTLIGRAALPGRGANAVINRLTKLYRHSLIAQSAVGIREHARDDGKLPLLYSLTRRGLEVAQTRDPAPAISPKREWHPIEQPRAARLAHDLHALGWAIELHRAVGELATDRWRTPRYATGRYPAPQAGSGQRRHPIALNEIELPDGQAITGRIGVMGTPAEHWYHAGRGHLFFAVEADIHHCDLSALALPPQPPGRANDSPAATNTRSSASAC